MAKHLHIFTLMLGILLMIGPVVSCDLVEPMPDHITPTPEPEPDPDPDPEPEPDPKPEPVVDPVFPSIHINTPNKSEIYAWSTDWVTGASGFVVEANRDTTSLGTLSIKARGNTSRWYPKTPYNIKLDEKCEIFGIDDNKSWCLLANWMDRTLLRNDVAFEIARRTKGLKWTPEGKFVDMYLNGEYQGNYYLVEKIKIGKHRVDVSDKGYILEFDSYFDAEYKFWSPVYGMPVNVKEPDAQDLNMDNTFFNRIKNDVTQIETAISKISSGDKGYLDYIDIDSYIDWFLVQELTMNAEAQHPKSSYMFRDETGKIYAGPAWDFDWYTFVPQNYGWINKKYIWYGTLFKSPAFVSRLKEKWAEEKDGFASIPEYIDEMAKYIEESAQKNSEMWPITQTVNGDETMAWDKAVARLRSSYELRYKKVNELVNSL